MSGNTFLTVKIHCREEEWKILSFEHFDSFFFVVVVGFLAALQCLQELSSMTKE